MLFKPKGEDAERARAFFKKLDTPINTATELGAASFSGRGRLALVGKVTTGMGLACFLIGSYPCIVNIFYFYGSVKEV